eukprot:TRINITY_DN91846_c0_g1_i1.p1 TRINITY_DN91846_c0_g1~~TRINITY_DN91846_c0_g1_i1.p1  ORF type:complete len:245 (-),score=55.48 TRINITY_DN91846_c0_g1_i1:72-806(-)
MQLLSERFVMCKSSGPRSLPRRCRAAVAGRRSALLSLLSFAVSTPAVAFGPDHVIIDADADIRDLDVGDLNDMDSDVTPMFREDLRKRKQPKVSMADMMKDPLAFANSGGSGMSMSFATLIQSEAEKLKKEGTDTLASRWKGMLEIGGVDCQVYAVDPGKVLFVSQNPSHVATLRDFVLKQPEVDWFEKDQRQFFPEGRNKPLMDNDERKQREIDLGWRQAAPAAKPKEKPKAKRRRRSKSKDL